MFFMCEVILMIFMGYDLINWTNMSFWWRVFHCSCLDFVETTNQIAPFRTGSCVVYIF